MLRFLVLLYLIAVTAAAQTAPIPSSSVAPSNQFTKADTVRAVNKLFARRRTGGIIGMSISAASLASLIPMTTSAGNDAFDAIKAITLLGVLPATLSTTKYIRFTEERERTILTAYDAGKPLPFYVKRRLLFKYFR